MTKFRILLVLGALMVSQEAVQASCSGIWSALDRCKSCCSSKGMSNCDGCGGANNPGMCEEIAGTSCHCCKKQAQTQVPDSVNSVAVPPAPPVPAQPVVQIPEAPEEDLEDVEEPTSPTDVASVAPTLPQGPYLEKCEECQINKKGIITCLSCPTAAGTALLAQLKPQGVTSLKAVPFQKLQELREHGFSVENPIVEPFNPKDCGNAIDVDAEGELTCTKLNLEKIFGIDGSEEE